MTNAKTPPAPEPSPWDSPAMLAEPSAPFSRDGWIFEVKYDGFRVRAGRDHGRVRLRYRRGTEATGAFPELVAALRALPAETVLDGEVVVVDGRGRPDFQRLQQRFQDGPRDAARAAAEHPAIYFAFDLLAVDGRDLRRLPLLERKKALRALLPDSTVLVYVDHVERDGEALFAEARRLGLEGVVGKRAASPYTPGRSRDWRKVRGEQTGDFVVVGWTRPALGSDGGLHLAARRGGTLVYAGRVGSGFRAGVMETVRRTLGPLRLPQPPCGGPVPKAGGHVWVEPRVVCEVRYARWTDAGLLRQPVFVRFQTDRTPSDL